MVRAVGLWPEGDSLTALARSVEARLFKRCLIPYAKIRVIVGGWCVGLSAVNTAMLGFPESLEQALALIRPDLSLIHI